MGNIRIHGKRTRWNLIDKYGGGIRLIRKLDVNDMGVGRNPNVSSTVSRPSC